MTFTLAELIFSQILSLGAGVFVGLRWAARTCTERADGEIRRELDAKLADCEATLALHEPLMLDVGRVVQLPDCGRCGKPVESGPAFFHNRRGFTHSFCEQKAMRAAAAKERDNDPPPLA